MSSALGVGRRRIYSVTGDALNLAARVVAAAAPGEVRCTEVARLALRSMFTLRPMDPFAAKGKSEPVVSYAVEGEAAASPAVVEHTRPAIIGRDEELKALGRSNGRGGRRRRQRRRGRGRRRDREVAPDRRGGRQLAPVDLEGGLRGVQRRAAL